MNKALVIDDDGYIRELICAVLKNEEFSVSEAVNGKDALKRFGEEKVDLCVLDFQGDERTLDVHINRLRERFPYEVYKFRITTIRGLGYRLDEEK